MRDGQAKVMRVLRLAVGLALVAVVGVWGWSQGGSAVAPAVEVKPTASQSADRDGNKAAGATVVSGAHAGPVHLDGRYAVRYALRYTAPGVDGKDTTANLTLEGTLLASATGQAGKQRWLALRLTVATATGNAAMVATTGLDNAQLRSGLAEPCAVEIDAQGRMGEARFAPGTPGPVQALMAGVAYAAQFARADDAPPAAWQTTERDVQGEYVADYARKDVGLYAKRWQVGGAGAAATVGDASARQQSNHVQIQVVASRIAAVECNQQGSLDLGAMGAERSTARYALEVQLRRTGDSTGPWAGDVNPAALVRFDAAAASAPAAAQEASRPMAELVRALVAAGGVPSPDQRSALRSAVLDALMVRPAAASEVDAALRTGGMPEPAERTLLEALAGAGTAPAQAVLVGLAVDRAIADTLRDRAIVAATQVATPGPQFTTALLAAVDARDGPVAGSTYAVALGAAVQRLSQADPARAQALAGELVRRAHGVLRPAGPAPARAANVPTLGDQRNWLAALGNGGEVTALPLLLETLASPQEALRLAAAHALRFQNPQDCKEKIAHALTNDDSADVRAALMHAARYMGPVHMATLVEKTLRFDKAELVCTEAAYTVASWSATAPGLRKVLAAALAVEKSPKVQKALEDLLAPAKAPTNSGSGAGK